METNDLKPEMIVIAMQKDIEYIKQMMTRLETYLIETKKENDEKFVTQDQFRPVKLVVYGMVGIVLVAVLKQLIGQ